RTLFTEFPDRERCQTEAPLAKQTAARAEAYLSERVIFGKGIESTRPDPRVAYSQLHVPAQLMAGEGQLLRVLGSGYSHFGGGRKHPTHLRRRRRDGRRLSRGLDGLGLGLGR